MPDQPDCCLCGQPCEPWVASDPDTGYGNNPWPYGDNDDDRCCYSCNIIVVIPARLNPMSYPSKARNN